jgi:hypothetical protein
MFSATSPDGIHWAASAAPVLTAYFGDAGVPVPLAGTPEPQQCVTRGCCTCWNLPATVSDVQALTYDPIRRGWSVYHKMWIDGPDGSLGWRRAMGHSFTADFGNWTQSHAQLLVAPDEEDAPPLSRLADQSSSRVPSDLHGAAVHYHAEAGLYIGRMMVYYVSTATDSEVIQQELIISRNGIDFERPFRSSRGAPFFLARNPSPDAFDHSIVIASNGNGPVAVEQDGGRMEDRFYYAGLNVAFHGHGTNSGVGFFSQPTDRYAGVHDTGAAGGDEHQGSQGGQGGQGGQVSDRKCAEELHPVGRKQQFEMQCLP